MWGLLLILAGSPMPVMSWHLTHDDCHAKAEVELLHAAVAGREVVMVECRSYLTPRSRVLTGAVTLR